MVIDAMCGFGVAAHVPHLLRLVVHKSNLLMEVNMRIKFDGVWELVAQRVQSRVSDMRRQYGANHCRKPKPSVPQGGCKSPRPLHRMKIELLCLLPIVVPMPPSSSSTLVPDLIGDPGDL